MKVTRVFLWLTSIIFLAAASTWANGTKESSSSAAATGSGEKPITLTVWNTEVPTAGIQTNDVAKEIERLTGVTMNVIQGDGQKFKVLVAGDDLPDIIYTNPAQQGGVESSSLIASRQVIPLDNLIDKYGPNIKKNFPERLDYSKQFLSGGTNKIYWLPVLAYKSDPKHPSISYTVGAVGWMLRWDVYAKIGYPPIKTRDDLLNVLKQMQQADPQTPDGKKVYGISGWSDWGIWPWFVTNTQEDGQYGYPNDVLFNQVTGEPTIEYNDPNFWSSIEFFNKAYRMGLLDTEAFTMKADNFWQKAENGQVLMAYASWQTNYINQTLVSNGHPEWGYEKIPTDGNPYVVQVIAQDAPLGSGFDYANAISSNCKDPVRAMKLLDFFNSDQGARLIWSGVQGKEWDYENGVPAPTASYLDLVKSDPNYRTKTGVSLYNKFSFASQLQVMADHFPADISQSSVQLAKHVLPIDKLYDTYWGNKYNQTFSYPGEALYYMWQNKDIQSYHTFWAYPLLVQPPSQDVKQTMSQIDQYMQVAIPKAILASSQADFDAQKAKIMTDINAMGLGAASKALLDSYATAKKAASSLNLN